MIKEKKMKVFQAIIMTVFIGFIGFFATMLTTLFTASTFYLWFLPIITVLYIITVYLLIFEWWKKKAVKKARLMILAISICGIAGYIIYEHYDKNLEVVSSQDTDLTEYMPFLEGTKAVSLKEESPFKIEKKSSAVRWLYRSLSCICRICSSSVSTKEVSVRGK